LRLYLLPHRRLRAYAFWLSFVLIGISVGLLRTPPAPVEPDAPELIAAEGQFPRAEGLEVPGDNASTPAACLVAYTVQNGDTLTSIAQKFNTSADSIAYINDLSSPDRISVGKELSVMQNGSGAMVKVSNGDTLGDIAKRYGVAVSEVVKANDLDNVNDISAGQVLLLPGATIARPAQSLSRSSTFIWPLKGTITSAFGRRIHPVSGDESYHEGIDIAGASGKKVYAAGSGEISFLGWFGDYGRLIIIDHGDGIETRYGHLSDYDAAEGDYVHAGDVIGYVGQSGNVTGPHLHFEVRRDGDPVNPRNYLP